MGLTVEEFSVPGTYKWIVPKKVHSVRFIGFGAGGGGGGPNFHPNTLPASGGAGGGGGGYIEGVVFGIVPGEEYTITVGEGGEGGAAYMSPNGTNDGYGETGHAGTKTQFAKGSEVYLAAFGGMGGSGTSVFIPGTYLGGKGGSYAARVGSTIEVRGIDGAQGGQGRSAFIGGHVGGPTGDPGYSVPNGGGQGGAIGNRNAYGGESPLYGAVGGGGGGGPRGDGGRSGDCGGSWQARNTGGTGGGGGGARDVGGTSATAAESQGAMTPGAKGANGWAAVIYESKP